MPRGETPFQPPEADSFRRNTSPEGPSPEKISQLQEKESVGSISVEEMETLLEADFEQLNEELPPLDQPFDPESEFQQLQELPKNERKPALEDFKQKLAIQREAWANCRTYLERLLMAEFNQNLRAAEPNDLKPEIYTQQVKKFAQSYGFSESQQQLAGEIIKDLTKKRQQIKKFRQKFPERLDPEAKHQMLKELTGQSIPQDRVKSFMFIEGPLSIDIICDPDTVNQLLLKSDDVVEGQPSAFGFSTQSKKGIAYNIISAEAGPSIVLHEREHQKFAFLESHFDKLIVESLVSPENKKQLNSGPLGLLRRFSYSLNRKNRPWAAELYDKYLKEKDPQKGQEALKNFFLIKRNQALVRVKDEIFANLAHHSDFKLQYIFLLFGGEKDPYDYLAKIRNLPKTKNDPVYQEMAQKYLREGYFDIVSTAIRAAINFREKMGFSDEQTIAFFADKPLNQWPKAAKRHLDSRKDKNAQASS